MDVGAMSIAMNQSKLMQNVSLAVTKMTMDTMSEQMNSLTDMMRGQMELSVNPSLGANIDISG